jgi:hypothetical protein
VSSVDVLVNYEGGAQSVFTTVTSLPTTINADLDDVLAALNLTVGDVAVGDDTRFAFKVTTSSGVYLSNRTLRVPFSCVSALKGMMDYTSTSYFCSGPDLTGTVEMIETGAGTYRFSDWSFGTYPECYGGNAASWGSLSLNDVCNKLTLTGVDNYGDSWDFLINSISGSDLTASWSNTYGEFGTVTLTRKDGKNWPPLSN